MHRDLKPSNWAFVIDGQVESETRSEVIEREAVEREVEREGDLEGKLVGNVNASGAHPHSQHEQQQQQQQQQVEVSVKVEAEAEAGLGAGAGSNGGTATDGMSGPSGTDDDGDSGIGQVWSIEIETEVKKALQLNKEELFALQLQPPCHNRRRRLHRPSNKRGFRQTLHRNPTHPSGSGRNGGVPAIWRWLAEE